MDKEWASALKLGGRYDLSVIPFQKAHDLYIKKTFQKVEKFRTLINKIFKFVKKITQK